MEPAMEIVWTNEAVEAALSQLKASRFASGMSHREALRQVLYAAANIQNLTINDPNKPSDIISDDGRKMGDWDKDKSGKWTFIPIYYD